jgi:hypothetical protein
MTYETSISVILRNHGIVPRAASISQLKRSTLILTRTLCLVLVATVCNISSYAQDAPDFSIIALPDTQCFSDVWPVMNAQGGRKNMFLAQTQWIKNTQSQILTSNAPASLVLYGRNGDTVSIPKIAFVAQLGDIGNNGDQPTDAAGNNYSIEYSEASTAMANLYSPNLIPFGIGVGNHEQGSTNLIAGKYDGNYLIGGTHNTQGGLVASPSGGPNPPNNGDTQQSAVTTNNFNAHFGTSFFSNPAFSSFYNLKSTSPTNPYRWACEDASHHAAPCNNNSYYETFSAGGADYLTLFIEYDPFYTSATYCDTAHSAVPGTPDCGVLDWAEQVVESNPSRQIIIVTHYMLGVGYDAALSAQGAAIYHRLQKYSNVFLALGGHLNSWTGGRRQDLYSPSSTTSPLDRTSMATLLSDYQGDGFPCQSADYTDANQTPCESLSAKDHSQAQQDKYTYWQSRTPAYLESIGITNPPIQSRGGDGLLRIYTISNAHNYLQATTYSPYEAVADSDPAHYTPTPDPTRTFLLDPGNAFRIQLHWSARLDIFYRNSDNSLGHSWFANKAWGGPQTLAGTLTSDPAAVSRGASMIDVFYRGSDGNLKWAQWDGSAWSNETTVADGIAISDAPAVASDGLYDLDVFFRGTDNKLKHISWQGGNTWSAVESVSGSNLTGPPAAVSWGPGRIDVVYPIADPTTGTTNVAHRALRSGSWSAEENRGAGIIGRPAISSLSPDQLTISVQGTNHVLYTSDYVEGSGWGAWTNRAAVMSDSPAAAAWSGDHLEVIMKGTDDTLRHTGIDNGGSWSTAVTIAGTPIGSPAVTSWSHF